MTRPIEKYAYLAIWLLLGIGCNDLQPGGDGVREREASTSSHDSKVRELHVRQKFPEREVSASEFIDAFTVWYDYVVLTAPKLEGNFRLEPGVTILGGDIAPLEDPHTIVYTDRSLIDGLDELCRVFNVYFKYTEGERIEIHANLKHLNEPPPTPLPVEGDSDPFRYGNPQAMQNKASIQTPDPLRVEMSTTVQPSIHESERALGQA